MHDELRLIEPRYCWRVQERLSVLHFAEENGMKSATLYFGLSYRTVKWWRQRMRRGGIQGLVSRYPTHRRSRISPEVRGLIQHAGTEERFGAARTQVWLQRVHGIHVGAG
jgi:transposase